MTTSYTGIGIGSGVASGKVVIVRPPAGVDDDERPSTGDDSQLVRDAMTQVSASLFAEAENVSEDAAAILYVDAQLATDKSLLKKIDAQLEKGVGITHAVWNAIEEFATGLKALGGYMAERVTDLYDVRDRAIAQLRGLPAPGINVTEPSILIARDLSPAQTATLDKSLILGIAISEGGPTSHTAILCSQRDIPALVRVSGLTGESIAPGTEVVIDASTGTLYIDLPDDQRIALEERARKREELLAHSQGPGKTADGHGVQLLANIGSPEEANSQGVEGCGLFRSEFLYLDRETAPDFDEQYTRYLSVFKEFAGKKVVVRTLDAGADKPLKFVSQDNEENPALGQRGLRLSQAHEDILDTQLQALAKAGKESDVTMWVMAPMVSTEREAAWFADRAHAAGIEHVGIMVEVPSAAIRAGRLLKHVDFASIGTNDLTQYTMAADRMQGDLGDLLSPWQPAVIDMIASTCDGAKEADAHVGVCGEAAADPALALVLVGLGVQSLSMAPARVPAVREALKMHTLDQCQKLAALARDARGADKAHQVVIDNADPRLRDIL